MKNLVAVMLLGVTLISCDNSKAPIYKKNDGGGGAIAYKTTTSLDAVSTCLPGKNYSATKGSSVSWRATKFKEVGKDIVMIGTNAVTGNLNINGTWANTTASMDFIASTTNSEDPLRDTRIDSFIFGLPEGQTFGFRLTKLEGDNMEIKDNETRNFKASGTLYVGGRTADIEMAVLVKDYAGSIVITPAEIFKLNIRSLSPVVNGVNLVDKVTQILTFVPGVQLHDDVELDFSLEFATDATCK